MTPTVSGADVVAAIGEPGGKLVEVVAGAGGPEVCLRRRDADGPHLRAPLHGMLTASTGRPWRIRPARPGSVQVRRTDAPGEAADVAGGTAEAAGGTAGAAGGTAGAADVA
ncbi:hypothetical protein, partial [Nonomuraea basaltis]|uniref:hypothetical protein n=1 Tax=Nonomuraea basaltis TaxID=2495887 RepID=UPI001981A1E0